MIKRKIDNPKICNDDKTIDLSEELLELESGDSVEIDNIEQIVLDRLEKMYSKYIVAKAKVGLDGSYCKDQNKFGKDFYSRCAKPISDNIKAKTKTLNRKEVDNIITELIKELSNIDYGVFMRTTSEPVKNYISDRTNAINKAIDQICNLAVEKK